MKCKLRNKMRYAWMVLGTFVLILSACASAAQPTRTIEKSFSGNAPSLDNSGGAVPQAPAPAEAPAQPAPETAPQPEERLVIKNASMSLVVPDPSESMNRISRMADALGGFVVSANMYQQTVGGVDVPRASITIRVPAEKLNEALDQIRAESKQKPQNESINSQDVTSDYVDLQSRLKNLEAAEAELTKIMQDAKKTEDVLAVYNQLVQIRGQIEQIKGQIKYYEQSAALSAISTELIADQAIQPIEIAGWKPVGVAKDAVESLLKTMQFLVSALIWIVIYVLPVLLVLFVIFVLPPVLIFRGWKKRRRVKNSAAKTIGPSP
jgi:hypothetical protein